MKEVSPKIQEQQYNIDYDIPTPIKLGKRTFMVKDLKQYVGSKISVLIAKKNGMIQDGSNIILNLGKINTLSAKVLSMAILGSRLKIALFHLQNIIFVESMNQMRIHLTKEEALSYQAEQISVKKQTS